MEPIDSENLIPLDAARRLGFLPRAYSFATVWGWTQAGIAGVTLEHRHAGGLLCTSEPAVRRFFAALTAARRAKADAAHAAKGRSPGAVAAEKYLDAQGVKTRRT